MLLRVSIAIVASLAIAGSAAAKEARIGSGVVTLPSPKGYCEMTDADPSDARAIKAISDTLAASKNEMLSMAADCTQLESWRAAKIPALDDYVQYQAPMDANAAEVPSNISRAAAVKEICANVRTEAGKAADAAPDLKSLMETAIKGAKFNEPIYLGVLAEDANACYYGSLQKLRSEVGIERTQLTVAAVTVVKGKVVTYLLYTVYRDGVDTLTPALDRHQRNVPELLAINGDWSGPAEVAKNDEHDGSHTVAPSAPVKETVPVKEADVKAPEAPAKEPAAYSTASLTSDKVKGRPPASHSWRNGHCLYRR